MKATIVLIADNDAENYDRKLMLEAHRYGKTGFEMARLPQHVNILGGVESGCMSLRVKKHRNL